eukprot:07878_3
MNNKKSAGQKEPREIHSANMPKPNASQSHPQTSLCSTSQAISRSLRLRNSSPAMANSNLTFLWIRERRCQKVTHLPLYVWKTPSKPVPAWTNTLSARKCESTSTKQPNRRTKRLNHTDDSDLTSHYFKSLS